MNVTVKFWPGVSGLEGPVIPTMCAEEGVMAGSRVARRREAVVMKLESMLETKRGGI